MTLVLFTPERAYAATLRAWGDHDAKRLAIAVTWGVYPEGEALRELSATLASHAERAGMKIRCRPIASSMLEDEIGLLEDRYNKVLQNMIVAAERSLTSNKRDTLSAAQAAADIARANQVPPAMIENALRIARWRTRRRA